MEIGKALEKVEKVLRDIKGTLDVKRLSSENRAMILELEETFEEEESNEFRRFYNEGIREVLERQEVIALVHTPEFRHPPAPFVKWKLGGVDVGEEVWDAKLIEELKENKNVLFIGKTFIIHRDKLKNSPLRDFIVLFPPLPFPELEGLNEIKDVTSASPSCPTDIYIKQVMGLDFNLGLVIIGFDLADSL
ncbi:MAG: hypothetical protein H3Z51_11465 [archaeon]|nr:hypothetical protein [archaeon]